MSDVDQEKCKHTTTARRVWVERDDQSGSNFGRGNWVGGGIVHTTADVDTHRYKCTQCGKIMYYSEAAKAYFEDGVKSGVPGLGG